MNATETHTTVMEIIDYIVDVIHEEGRMVTDDNLSLLVMPIDGDSAIPITKENLGIWIGPKK